MEVRINTPPMLAVALSSDEVLSFTLDAGSEGAPIAFIINTPTEVPIEHYDGAYVITPRSSEQVLETKDKRMDDDVTIEQIPYYETSNEFGITVYIG